MIKSSHVASALGKPKYFLRHKSYIRNGTLGIKYEIGLIRTQLFFLVDNSLLGSLPSAHNPFPNKHCAFFFGNQHSNPLSLTKRMHKRDTFFVSVE